MSDGKVVFDITGDLSGINDALEKATDSIGKKTAKWTALAQAAMNGITAAGKAAFRFVGDLMENSFDYNAQMEQYEMNFRTLLGSAEEAQSMLAGLRTYAASTPLSLSDLTDATQTLLTFGLSSTEATQALSYLGDISLGDANKLQSLALAFAQVASTGKLMGQDLLQMINAGFNPLQTIAEKTGVSIGDLKKVMSGDSGKTSEAFNLRVAEAVAEVERLGDGASESAKMLAQIGKDGEISAEMIKWAMRIATSEGGMFYKALQNASKTALGQISTIRDKWDMFLGNIGRGGFDYLSQSLFPKAIEWLDKLNAAYEKHGLAGIKAELPGIMREITGEVLDVASTIYAAVYEALTGQELSKEDARAQIMDAVQKVSDFFASVKEMVDKITGIIDWASDKLGINKAKEVAGGIVQDWQDMGDHYAAPEAFKGFGGWSASDMASAVDYIRAYNQVRQGNKEYSNMMANAMAALNQSRGRYGDVDSFATAVDELFAAVENGDPLKIPAAWQDGMASDLQAALDGLDLSVAVGVNPYVQMGTVTSGIASWWNGLFGKDHATGGVFTSATRMMGEDGMHTFGESGTEVLLPLDALWRKMGFLLDSTLTDRLSALQYTVLPPLPAATPTPPQDDDLPDKVAKAVREAVSDITLEMDKRTVGKIVAPVVSREMADSYNERMWTS